jgi:hypothetical protein
MPASLSTVWTAKDWFQEAEAAYTERHQGCPWCEGSHRVSLRQQASRTVYHCQTCDFQVSHDSVGGTWSMVPGEEQTVVPETMHDWHSPKLSG